MKIVVTGAAGFIGSNLVRHLLATVDDLSIIALDSLAYAGHRANLESIPGGLNSDRHTFIHGSICDATLVGDIVSGGVDGIINLAAHTHVDRAFYHPEVFIHNNVEGLLTLLRAIEKRPVRLVQVSTDEVYGATTPDKPFDENAPLRPGNYYASSKAAADLYIAAAINTSRVDALIVRGTNNFGPRQYPEKLIPFFTRRIIAGETLPLYGDGRQMRDWLYVEDFCRAIWTVFSKGETGQIYNAGAGNHIANRDLALKMISILKADPALVKSVTDRPGHDFCYAVSWQKINRLGWRPQAAFDTALAETVNWYKSNQAWADTIMEKNQTNHADHLFFDRHYKDRE